MDLQKQGIPSILVVTERFKPFAESLASLHGYKEFPTVVLPHPFHSLSAQDILQLAEEKAHEIISGVVSDIGPDLKSRSFAESANARV